MSRFTYWLCHSFPNNSGIQAVVLASSASSAISLAKHHYYGIPQAREAAKDEVEWHLSMGGEIISG